jgi:hypothetical protein
MGRDPCSRFADLRLPCATCEIENPGGACPAVLTIELVRPGIEVLVRAFRRPSVGSHQSRSPVRRIIWSAKQSSR